jgi:SAM-dependent methyltransferase
MTFFTRIRRAVRRRGLWGALRASASEIWDGIAFSYPSAIVINGRRTFRFEGRSYSYFVARYNTTWRSERAVEIPIVWQIVKESRGRRILEVGNVLRHYFPVDHDCVDKYELAPGVINEDIVDYRAEPYDLIVSISTLEHVGWDEEPRDPDKVLRAVENLRSLIAPGGRFVLTLPIGHNPHLDSHLRGGRLALSSRSCLKRASRHNRWEETSWEQAQTALFDTPFRRVNALVIGAIDRSR